MKPIKLKDNIYIEGFDTTVSWADKMDTIDFDETRYKTIYSGRTSEIPEDLLNKVSNCMFFAETPERRRYFNYGEKKGVNFPFLTAKESIQSACDKEYCIIYKMV